MLETVTEILKLIGTYGADTVLMVFFFFLYVRSQKRNEGLQDNRLDDSKKALEALIEARHAMDEIQQSDEELTKELREHFEAETENFRKVRARLHSVEAVLNEIKEK